MAAAVSDFPADWLRQITERIQVDSRMPPGVMAMKSGGDQVAVVVGGTGPDLRAEAVAEDYRSLGECWPYVVRLSERGEPIVCEGCGTLVASIPEALTESAGGEHWSARRWKPGSWEHETLRRHTMRRCEWRRANP